MGKYLGQPFCHFKSRKEAFNGLLETLARRLTEWKQRSLSMAGRSTLIKSVIHALPSYTMQIFMLPRGLLAGMERKIKKFSWGFREGKSHNLHLRAWKDVCQPQICGGVGFRKLSVMNKAFVTKLSWSLCSQSDKIWVQLVRAKHLQGRRLLDSEHTKQVSSWIWGGIRSCLGTLDVGLSYQVGQNSMLRIRHDAWLPQFANHHLPPNLHVPPHLVHVRDLMTLDGLHWDPLILRQFCPHPIAEKILRTPVLNMEHDRPIWCPSTSGTFYHQVYLSPYSFD